MVVAEMRLLADGRLHVGHHRQGLVVDVDEFDRVLRGGLAAGDDHRHGLADVVDLLDGHRRVPGVDHVGRHGPGAGDGPLLLGEVAAGVDGDDAG